MRLSPSLKAWLHTSECIRAAALSMRVSYGSMPKTGPGRAAAEATRPASQDAESLSNSAPRAPRCTSPGGRRASAGRSTTRPETIEETAELVNRAEGEGIAVPADHLVPDEVRALTGRIRAGHGRLDVLVNDIWGGELLVEWGKPVWEHDPANGLRMLHLAIDNGPAWTR
jgi:NAD(P)-dependent dehydrogenase (short-subunit alcohol dehydrogenase family)